MQIVRSATLFLLAGLCEIAGGYLIWLWLRSGRSIALAFMGATLLLLYGVLPTLQPSALQFGRVYAVYGGVFIALAVLWGWWIDKHRPDGPEIIGGTICLIGVSVIMYWPRR